MSSVDEIETVTPSDASGGDAYRVLPYEVAFLFTSAYATRRYAIMVHTTATRRSR